MTGADIIRHVSALTRHFFVANELDGGFRYISLNEWAFYSDSRYLDRLTVFYKESGHMIDLSHRRIWINPSDSPIIHPIRCRPEYEAIPANEDLVPGYPAGFSLGEKIITVEGMKYFGEAPWPAGIELYFAGYKTERFLHNSTTWKVGFAPHVKFPDGTYRFMPKCVQKALV